ISAVPLFAGVTPNTAEAKIFSYDVTGGRFEEHHWHSIGSGSPYALTTLKRLWDPTATSDQAIKTSLQAMIDAAESDAATAGPDPARGLYPIVYVVTGHGVQRIADGVIADFVAELTGKR